MLDPFRFCSEIYDRLRSMCEMQGSCYSYASSVLRNEREGFEDPGD